MEQEKDDDKQNKNVGATLEILIGRRHINEGFIAFL